MAQNQDEHKKSKAGKDATRWVHARGNIRNSYNFILVGLDQVIVRVTCLSLLNNSINPYSVTMKS
jgi:hypothetical protein